MIVRWKPHHQVYMAPVASRDRRYVRLAWGIRSIAAIARRLGVDPKRVDAFATDLGIRPPPKILSHNDPESTMVEVPADIIRRCQECSAMMFCRHCQCGWEAVA